MKRLNKRDVIDLHNMLIDKTGGANGLRDEGMLESALAAPFQTFAGEYLYESIFEMATHLGFGLIKNHPFVDGNKRIGILVMLVFLDINGVTVECTDAELIKLGIDMATGQAGCDDILDWILSHCQ